MREFLKPFFISEMSNKILWINFSKRDIISHTRMLEKTRYLERVFSWEDHVLKLKLRRIFLKIYVPTFVKMKSIIIPCDKSFKQNYSSICIFQEFLNTEVKWLLTWYSLLLLPKLKAMLCFFPRCIYISLVI